MLEGKENRVDNTWLVVKTKLRAEKKLAQQLNAARDQKVKRFVYAASSATCGDSENYPKLRKKLECLSLPMRSRNT